MADERTSGGERLPGISVVMATYQGAAYLEEQLRSIAAQTLAPRELLVGDDGSTDGTQAIVERFAATAPFPVHLHQHSRRGVTGNFLSTARHARSSLIAWSDQDDVWKRHKLERSVAALEGAGAVLVFHNVEVVDEALVPTGRTFKRRPYETLERFQGEQWECFSGMATVFAAHLLDGVEEDALPGSAVHAGPWHHDEVVHEMARLTGRRAIVADTLVLYRQHSTNTAGVAPVASLSRRMKQGGSKVHRRYETAAMMRSWAQTVPRLSGDAEVLAHLDRLVRDERIRVGLLSAPGVGGRLKAFVSGVGAGSYRSRLSGGRGWTRIPVDLRAAISSR